MHLRVTQNRANSRHRDRSAAFRRNDTRAQFALFFFFIIIAMNIIDIVIIIIAVFHMIFTFFIGVNLTNEHSELIILLMVIVMCSRVGPVDNDDYIAFI